MSTGIQVVQPSELAQSDITQLEQALTTKQRLFVNAWLGEARGNGLLAARIAGYGTETSNDAALMVAAAQVLSSTKVQSYIDAILHAVGINPQSIALQLYEGLHTNVFEGVDIGNLDDTELRKLNSRLIKRITVTEQAGVNGTMRSVSIEPVDRTELIKLAMRATGMDRQQVTVNVNQQAVKLVANVDLSKWLEAAAASVGTEGTPPSQVPPSQVPAASPNGQAGE